MIHYALVNQDGELEGEKSAIFASSHEKVFERLEVPEGYRKVLLTHDEYEMLSLDFDEIRKVYRRKLDLIESVTIVMQDPEIQAVLDKRPEWYRDTLEKDGRIKREKKDGTVWEVNGGEVLKPWVDVIEKRKA